MPKLLATSSVSTRCRPEVITNNGKLLGSLKIIEDAICPTSIPSPAAASAALFAVSVNTLI